MKVAQTSTHIMLAALRARDIPADETKTIKVVREGDLEGFEVHRWYGKVRWFKVVSATHFPAGYKLAKTIGEVRKIIANA